MRLLDIMIDYKNLMIFIGCGDHYKMNLVTFDRSVDNIIRYIL